MSAPEGILEDESWECAVVFVPFAMSEDVIQNLSQYPITNGTVGATALTNRFSLSPGLNIFCGPSGFDWSQDAAGDTYAHVSDLRIPDSQLEGQYKLVAGGFQVHNTTSTLYTSGSVSNVHVDDGAQRGTYFRNHAGSNQFYPMTTLRTPPTTIESVTQYPGSAVWAAREGSYHIFTLSDPTNKSGRLISDTIGMYQQYQHTGSWVYAGWAPPPDTAIQMSLLNWDMSVSHYSGLSAQTTLNVTVRYYLESFPGPQDPIVSLARETTPYCPLIMCLYSLALQDLVPYTKIKYNPTSKWLNAVLGAISKVAVPTGTIIGGAFGVPEIGALGGEVLKVSSDFGRKMLDHYTRDRHRSAKRMEGEAAIDYSKALVATQQHDIRNATTLRRKGNMEEERAEEEQELEDAAAQGKPQRAPRRRRRNPRLRRG